TANPRDERRRKRNLLLQITGAEVRAYVESGHQSTNDSEQRIEQQQLARMRVSVLSRNCEGRMIAEYGARHHSRDDARDHDRRKGAGGKSTDDFFEREEGTGEWRIERGTDGCACCAADQHHDSRRSEAKGSSEPRSDHRAEHDDRSLVTSRAAGADRDCACGRSCKRRSGLDVSATPYDGELHVGDVHSFVTAADVAHDPPGDSESGRGDHRAIREQRKTGEFRRWKAIEGP